MPELAVLVNEIGDVVGSRACGRARAVAAGEIIAGEHESPALVDRRRISLVLAVQRLDVVRVSASDEIEHAPRSALLILPCV